MKKISSIILFAALMLVYTSCGKGDSPKSITEKFLSAVSSGDYDVAKKFGTEDTDRLLDFMSSFKKMGVEPGGTDLKFEVTDEQITGDQAVVKVHVDGHAKEQQFNLIKEDGKWKVAMTKATLNETDENIFNLGATSTDTTGLVK